MSDLRAPRGRPSPVHSCSASLFQVLPVSAATREVRRSRGYAANELVFEARAPPLGFTTYSVSLLEGGAPPTPVRRRTPPSIQNQVKADRKRGSARLPVPTNPSVCSSSARPSTPTPAS